MAPDAVLTAGHADDDVVAHDERRVGDAVPEGRVGDFLVPEHFAGLGVERDEVGVEGAHVDVGPAVDRDPAVVGAAAEDRGAELVAVAPELLVRSSGRTPSPCCTGVVTYMTPFWTIGVFSKEPRRSMPVWNIFRTVSRATLPALICLSVE